MAGIPFDVRPADCDEARVVEHMREQTPDLDDRSMVEQLALAKAMTVARRHPNHVILAADTVVTLDGVVYGKPVDPDDARRMLRTLAGNTHIVDTGVAIVAPDRSDVFSSVSRVTFRPRTPALDRLIDRYVATGDPLDKAGAYGIQELGGLLIEHIDGDFFAVMGLPIAEVYARLQAYDIEGVEGTSCTMNTSSEQKG